MHFLSDYVLHNASNCLLSLRLCDCQCLSICLFVYFC